MAPESYDTREIVVMGHADGCAQVDKYLRSGEYAQISAQSEQVSIKWMPGRRGGALGAQRFADCISSQTGMIRGGSAGRMARRFLTVSDMLASSSLVYRSIYEVIGTHTVKDVLAKLVSLPLSPSLADEPYAPANVYYEPNYIVGDQHCISGSPARGAWANEGGLKEQWAWKFGHGIALDLAAGIKGNGTAIAVLDTSPFDLAVVDVSVDPGVPQYQSWLRVQHRAGLVQGAQHNSVALPHHGLCAASLAHSVAPDASLELVRVLNMFVEGDIASVAQAIIKVSNDTVARATDGQNPEIIPQVINLSLHLESPEEHVLPGTLAYAICAATANGCIVVASAGNDSRAGQEPEAQNYPACMPNVIGVAASGQDGAQAWFSNKGDVMAPGCAITAMVNERPPLSNGCAVVSGSSFAAPIVSGLAALMFNRYMRSDADPSDLVACADLVRDKMFHKFHERFARTVDGHEVLEQAIQVVNVGEALQGD